MSSFNRTSAGKKPGSPALRWGVLIALWCCFIWGHSLIQGPESSSESGCFYALLQPLFNLVGLVDEDTCTFIIRKCAHFSEYAVLGALVLNLVRSLVRQGSGSDRLHKALLPAFGLVAVADETLQLFVPGRSGSPRDVAIDLCGYAFGAFLATVVVKHRRKA